MKAAISEDDCLLCWGSPQLAYRICSQRGSVKMTVDAIEKTPPSSSMDAGAAVKDNA